MTRHERLDKSAAASRDKIAEEKRKLASTQSAQREDARKARDKGRYALGVLCDQAGLLGCEAGLLQDLLALAARIASRADSADVLGQCLALVGGSPGTSVEGTAHPTDGVATS